MAARSSYSFGEARLLHYVSNTADSRTDERWGFEWHANWTCSSNCFKKCGAM